MKNQPNRQIPTERKASYYLGMGLTVLGFLLFISNFFTIPQMVSSSPGGFTSGGNPMSSMMIRAVGGMVLIILGSVLRRIGVRGVAGSGVILDPEQARRDVEPWSRMAGGVVSDALDESGIDLEKDSTPELNFDEKLRKIEKLHQDGLLSNEEYQQKRSDILNEDW